jgi:hypothetical protein
MNYIQITDDALSDMLFSLCIGVCSTQFEWTDKAQGYISSGEYKYLSPVFMYSKTNRLIDAYGLTLQMNTAQVPAVDLDSTLDIIEPLGHTIIALNNAPAVGDDTEAYIDHLNFVSDAIEQRPAILVVPLLLLVLKLQMQQK